MHHTPTTPRARTLPRSLAPAAVLLLALAALVSAPLARADDPRDASTDVFRRVDAGRSDVGPSSTSRRILNRDPRTPSGFEFVYRIERGPYAGRFARRDGAVTAVFPRSVYADVDGVAVPRVPPGTTFVVGPVDRSPAGSGRVSNTDRSTDRPTDAAAKPLLSASRMADYTAAAGAAGSRPDARADARSPRPAPAVAPLADIWIDERVRRDRVHSLLESVRPAARRR